MAFVVCDSYIEEMGKYLEDNYQLLFEGMDEYIKVMRQANEEGIVSGKTSDGLKEFLSQVSVASSENDSGERSMGAKYKRLCKNYIKSLDDADGELY